MFSKPFTLISLKRMYTSWVFTQANTPVLLLMILFRSNLRKGNNKPENFPNMENNTQNHPTHQDRYETNISGDINQLSIGQLLKYKLEDGLGSAVSDCTKKDIYGQYNTKIKLNVPKQEQSPTIVFNFPTKNNGTVLQLDPRTTREFLESGRLPNLNNCSNPIISPPIEAITNVKFIS